MLLCCVLTGSPGLHAGPGVAAGPQPGDRHHAEGVGRVHAQPRHLVPAAAARHLRELEALAVRGAPPDPERLLRAAIEPGHPGQQGRVVGRAEHLEIAAVSTR